MKSVIWCTDLDTIENKHENASIGFARLTIAILENALSVVNFT